MDHSPIRHRVRPDRRILLAAACALLGAAVALSPASALGPGPSGPGSTGADGAIEAARADLAERERVDPADIAILRVDGVTWRDGCLGIYEPGVYCTMALVDGYAIWLGIEDQAWRYHTNDSGSIARLAAGPFPAERVPYEPTPPGTAPGGWVTR